jgi:hypothetical protein
MSGAKILDHGSYGPPTRWVVEYDGVTYEVHTHIHTWHFGHGYDPALEIDAVYAVFYQRGAADKLVPLDDLKLGTAVVETITDAIHEAIEDKISDLALAY